MGCGVGSPLRSLESAVEMHVSKMWFALIIKWSQRQLSRRPESIAAALTLLSFPIESCSKVVLAGGRAQCDHFDSSLQPLRPVCGVFILLPTSMPAVSMVSLQYAVFSAFRQPACLLLFLSLLR